MDENKDMITVENVNAPGRKSRVNAAKYVTAYICVDFARQVPVTEVNALRALLERIDG